MRTKELGSRSEGKTADSKQAPDHASYNEIQAPAGSHSTPAASLPAAFSVPQTHSRLHHLPYSQSALARSRLLQLQRLYGNRYVQRVLHPGPPGDAAALPSVSGPVPSDSLADRAKADGDDTAIDVHPAPVLERAVDLSEAEAVMTGPAAGQLRPSPDLHQTLDDAQGRALPEAARSSLESAPGADLSNINIHTGADAVEMNQQLGSHAFAYGSRIYFNEDKDEPESPSGKHLLGQTGPAHAKYSQTDVPDIQAAWYNFRIPFTDYEFDPSIEGIKTAAGVVADKAQEGAAWVKDKVVEGVEWVYDKISGLVNEGIDWLTAKYNDIKEFATSSFEDIKTALSGVLDRITSPMAAIKGAFTGMDAAILASSWNALSMGANAAWQTIKTVIDGVLKIGSGIWNTVSGFVTSLFDTVGSLLDSTPFKLLPEFLQSGARKLYNTVRSLWESIRDFWNDFWQRLTSFTRDLLASIESFVQRVVSYAIDVVIATVKKLKEVYDFVQLLVTDPEAVIRPIVEQIAGKIQSEGPPRARETAQQKMSEALSATQSSRSSPGTIQRSPQGPITRSRATRDEVNQALLRTFAAQWAALDIRKMLWETIVNLFWPPATIRSIGHEFYELWNTDWANAVDSLFAPRNIFDDFTGFFHDLWSNILILLDFPLALWRRLNTILMLLMGYVTIILVIVGAVGGAIVGNVPGALAGAAAGLQLSWAIGEALFLSFIFAEGTSVLKAFLDLFTARQTQKEKDRDYLQIAGSSIGIGIAIVVALIFMFLGAMVSRIVALIKGRAMPKQLGPGSGPPKQLGPGSEQPPKTEPPTPTPQEPPTPTPQEPPTPTPQEPPTPKPQEPPTPAPQEPPTPAPQEPPTPAPQEPPTPAPQEPPVPQEPPAPKPPKKKPPKQEPPAPAKDLKDLTIEELAREGDKKLRPKETKEQAEARVEAAKAEAQRRGYCFAQGTLIQTPEGPRRIETLGSGQLVLAKGEGDSVREYAVIEPIRSSTLTLYHLEISGTLKLATTGNHPFYIPGRGWTKAKDLVVGDQLLSLTSETVNVKKIFRERLVEPVDTFNLHVDQVHNYFVGNGPSVLVHNGPVNNPALEDGLIWGLGAKGPRQRMPSPGDPTSPDPKLREPIAGDTDGASGWRTNSTDDVGRLLGARKIEGGTSNHGAITEAQLASKGLVAVNTEGTGALAEARFQHVSIRPQSNPDANIPLTEAEMAEVKTKLEELTPVAQNKAADFLC